MNLYRKIDRKIRVMSRVRSSLRSAKHYKDLRIAQGLPVIRLTREQKEQVQQVWNGHVKSYGYGTHELVLSATGKFDPYLCSGPLFQADIELKLNSSQLKSGFSDKNYFDRMLPGIAMPKTVLRNINGTLLDEQYRPVTQEQAQRLMSGYETLIAKPSLDNGGGKGVKLFQNEAFSQIGKEMGNNYIVQEVLRQHSSVASLNPSSVNVVRVVSLSLNGRVSPVNCALRCGAEGALVDNYITKDGRGMYVVGVNHDGTLKNEAFYPCGDKFEGVAPNGTTFAGLQLPNFEEALKMTTSIHEILPHFGIIGFDLCFDEAGTPRLMEFNIRSPGALYYQYANGPLFGDRTQEIIDTFCK